MDGQKLAPNESIQLHELITIKNLSLTKAATMSLLVSDEELKTILKNDSTTAAEHIEQLKSLMGQSNLAVSDNKED